MAIWQFDIWLVPRAALGRAAPAEAERIDPILIDEISDWARGEFLLGYAALLDGSLPRGKGWHRDMEVWGGPDDGTRIELHWQGDRLDEVRVRLDLRSLDQRFIERIVDLARQSAAALVSEEGEVISVTVDAVLKEAQNSSARRYVVDPQAFFADGHTTQDD